MTKRMLIDAGHPEETRVVIVDGTKVEELDFESAAKKQLRGNLYLARVTRVEPSLQAAFVEYGGNRHGFLAFSEIHPDYYKIPEADKQALLEAEEAEARKQAEEDDAEEEAKTKKKRGRKSAKSKTGASKKAKDESDEDTSAEGDEKDLESEDDADADAPSSSEADEAASESNDAEASGDEDGDAEDVGDDADSEVADEQEKTAKRRRTRSFRNRYKIQEVIKRGQILLIQVVKEERGNKGAAMTTYLSLAGRYCVLMPNTPKGGGISRKISNGSDRKRLKSIVSEFKVPQGMGVIVRTAGAKRTKTEVKRDYDYLCRLWETIRTKTLESIAPSLIHEEGDLVKRSIRDLYNKDIKEVLVQGDDAYKTAKDFIKMLMPSHAKNVKAYKDEIPLFLRYQVESQIEESLESVVQLKSGGYLVIHPTEALVSIDVNSGRSTKERNVERTALKTNLEAAVEVARQMRLRDLAGLVVIDFIDMDEYRNNRAVEKRMKEALSRDRARVQAGRISQFGLMEISRQRRRRSLLEGSTISCPHCEGVGRKRTIESSALRALRSLEEMAARAQTLKARLKVAPDVAAFILNHKREQLQDIQDKFGMFAVVEADPDIMSPEFSLNDEQKRKDKAKDPLADIQKELKKEKAKSDKSRKSKSSKESEDIDENEEDDREPKKRRRRGRRGGRRRKSYSGEEENKTNEGDSEATESSASEDGDTEEKKPKSKSRRRSTRKSSKSEDKAETKVVESQDGEAEKDEKPKKRRSRTRSKKVEEPSEEKAAETKTEAKKPARKSRTKSKAKDKDAEPVESKPDSESETAAKKSSARSTTRRKAPSRKTADNETTKTAKADKKTPKADEKKDEKPKKKPTRGRKKAEDTADKAEKKDTGKKRTGWWSRKG